VSCSRQPPAPLPDSRNHLEKAVPTFERPRSELDIGWALLALSVQQAERAVQAASPLLFTAKGAFAFFTPSGASQARAAPTGCCQLERRAASREQASEGRCKTSRSVQGPGLLPIASSLAVSELGKCCWQKSHSLRRGPAQGCRRLPAARSSLGARRPAFLLLMPHPTFDRDPGALDRDPERCGSPVDPGI